MERCTEEKTPPSEATVQYRRGRIGGIPTMGAFRGLPHRPWNAALPKEKTPRRGNRPVSAAGGPHGGGGGAMPTMAWPVVASMEPQKGGRRRRRCRRQRQPCNSGHEELEVRDA